MGIGYQASALHRMTLSKEVSPPDADAGRNPDHVDDIVSLLQASGVDVRRGHSQRYSPSIAEILAWRQVLSSKCRAQLEEDLLWDEESEFALSYDLAPSTDVLLRACAAALDLHGETAARAVLGTVLSSHSDRGRVLAQAEARGLAGRFPQLLLGAEIWLPFKKNVVLEEADWAGRQTRFGSVTHLLDEIAILQHFIAETDPSAKIHGIEAEAPVGTTLGSAWQASDGIGRAAAAALGRKVPLWTTG